MAGAKEIRTKIASVQSTQKITKAMEMVAASKMRKTQERMSASRPYSDAIRRVISHISLADTEYKHPFLVEREIKKVGFLIVSTDRGLCGGLNINLFKSVLERVKTLQEKNIKVSLGIIGSKGVTFFQSIGLAIDVQQTGLGDTPEVESLIGVANQMFDDYKEGNLDAVYLVYNKFINTMSQKNCVDRLIPSDELLNKDQIPQNMRSWDYIYEPNAKELLEQLFVRYLESQIYQAVVENLASEQAARMVAMKAATDNAGSLIKELQLVYNKARQTSITNELNEIVAGAAAI